MAIVSAVNVTSPNAIAWATVGSDRFVRQTHLAGVTENLDLHDHGTGRGLAVKRLDTSTVPAGSGQVRVNGDDWTWWGATALAVQTAVRLAGTQTITGAKTFSGGLAVTAGTFTYTNNQNAQTAAVVTNTDAGTASSAGLQCASDAGRSLFIGVAASGYATAPYAAKGFVQCNAAAGLMLQNNNNGPIQFYVGPTGTTLAGSFASTGALTLTAGLSVSAGNVGVGLAPSPNVGVSISSTILSGSATQYGLVASATHSSAATSSGYALYGQVVTQAAAFTMGNAVAVYADNPSKGAGSTITTAIGVQIAALTAGGTNNIGLHVSQPSGAASANTPVYVAGGMVGIGALTNANMTTGVTINQGAADDEIIALKSSDVAHGVTGVTQTDTYAYVRKALGVDGGLEIAAISEASGGPQAALYVNALTNNADTAKATSAQAAIRISGSGYSGTIGAALGSTANIAAFQNAGTTRFIFQADGTSYEDVGTAWVNYSTHDDVGLLTRLSLSVSTPGDPIHAQFREWADVNRDELQALDLIHFNEDGHHFINRSKTQMLLIGAAMQLGQRLAEQTDRIAALEARLALVGG